MSMLPAFCRKSESDESLALRALGLASVAVGVAALGLFVGRELRLRYKFKHRKPEDLYAHAGGEYSASEYGVGT